MGPRGGIGNDSTVGSRYRLPSDRPMFFFTFLKMGSAARRVEVAFTVHEDFENYVGGVYASTAGSKEMGGHAVKLVGWGIDGGTPYPHKHARTHPRTRARADAHSLARTCSCALVLARTAHTRACAAGIGRSRTRGTRIGVRKA